MLLMLLLCFVGTKLYAQPPAPGFTGTTTICTGNATTITATGQAGASFRWYDSGGTLRSSAATYTIPVQAGAGTFHWFVEQTVSGLTGPRADVAIVVNQTPTIGITPTTPSVCLGSSTTITASGATSYSWSPGGGTTAAYSVSPATNTVYTATGTANGCSATASVTVNVNKTVASNDVTICYGNSTTLSASGASTYTWNPGNLSGSSVSVSPTATTTYIVSGTGSGCTTTDTVIVTVRPNLGLTVNGGVASASIAQGSSFDLTCTSVIPATYVWSVNPGNIYGPTGALVKVVPAQTATYTAVATDANGCTAQANVTVNVNVLANVTGATTVCSGSTASFAATGTGPFAWYNVSSGGGPLQTGSNYTTPALSANTSYWVSDNGGPRKEIKISVSGAPVSNGRATPSSVCNGDTSQLRADYLGAVKWYDAATGGNLVGTVAADASLAVSPSVTTTYYAEGLPVQVTKTFNYTGTAQTWTVPAGVTSINIDAYGSAGDHGPAAKPYNSKGGRVQATMSVTPGQVLNVYVGGMGGFNGGGGPGTASGSWAGSRGGDATDIRIGGTALTDRVLVAGGGGGTGNNATGGGNILNEQGQGGGLAGQNGGFQALGDGAAQQGKGGSQIAAGTGGVLNGVTTGNNYGLGGNFGSGGRAGAYSGQYSGGGGGGGWYGGGGGTASGDGGGGSSYTNALICHNVTHTQGAWDDVGIVFISYGISCTANATRIPVTVTVRPVLKPIVSDTLLNPCAGSALDLYASGLIPSKEVAAFDGNQAQGGVSGITSVANNFTMEFWVKPGSTITQVAQANTGATGTGGQRYAIMPAQSGTNAGAGVSVGTNGINVFEHGNSYIPALLAYNGAITDTAFTHVAVVYTNKKPALYLNGGLVATGLTSTMPNIYPSTGSDGTGGYGPFIGQLDNVRIWNAALTQAEVLSVMGNAEATVPGKNLVARYTFNGGSRADDKGSQSQWTAYSSNPQQTHYTYTWSGTAAAPAASVNEKQSVNSTAGTTRYWVRTRQNGCTSVSDTTIAVADTAPTATVSGATTVCQDAAAPLITFTGSTGSSPYTFTYKINGGSDQTVTTPVTPVRYIRFQQNVNDYIHISEIRAIESGTGTNVALGKGGTVSSASTGNTITNATDNNTGTFWHSNGTGTGEYIEIDLGAAFSLDRVEVVNRGDCCWDRERNLQYTLKNAGGTTISTQQINAWQNQNSAFSTSWPATANTTTVATSTTIPGSYQYGLVSIKTKNGCVNNQSGTAQVTVTAKPLVTVSTPSTTICQGANVTITPTVKNATSPSYQWYRNATSVSTSASYTNNAFTNNDSVSLKVTTTGACASVPATAYVKLRVSSNPVAMLSGGGCSGDTLSVLATPVPSQVQWLSGSTVQQTRAASWQTNAATVAGGTSGSALTQLNGANRSFVDAAGNVYIPDVNNHRVVKWAPGASAGVVVAGGNGAGSGASQLNSPMGVCVDEAGNIYVADFSNQRVQKWTPGASTGTTVAGITGSAGATANRLREPVSVAVDAYGSLYVTECYNHRVSKWVPGVDTGIVVAGKSSGASGTDVASLNFPYAARVDAMGNVYVADNSNARIVKWAPGASSGTIAAGNGSAGPGAGQLNTPSDVFIDGSGILYISDQNNNRIVKWLPGASSGSIIAGTGSAGNGANQLNGPSGVMMDGAGNLYVTETNNNRVQKFAAQITDTVYKATAPGSYTAVITNFDGCATTSAAKNIVQSAVITAEPAANMAVCGPVNPVVLVTTATNATSYQWRKVGVNIPLATSAEYVKKNATSADAGQYVVIAYGNNGCNDTSTASTVTYATMSNTLATTSSTATSPMTDDLKIYYSDASCRPIASISDAAGGNVLGATTASVIIDGTVQAYHGQPYLQRHYDLQPLSNGAATVELYATQAEFDAYNTYVTTRSLSWPLLPTGPSDNAGMANISITQFHGLASAGNSGPGGQYLAAQRELIPNNRIAVFWNGNYWVLSAQVTGFSGFFITSGSNTPLPVELRNITATNMGAYNRIDWSTASEESGDYFEVERSLDAKSFSKISTVRGRSQTGAVYSSNDEQPASGINYYRLKMLDATGRYVYSKVVSATVKEGSFVVEAYPNPAKDKVTIHTSGKVNGTANVSVLDVSGRVLYQADVTSNDTVIPLSSLAPGVYMLRYRNDNLTKTIKINKE